MRPRSARDARSSQRPAWIRPVLTIVIALSLTIAACESRVVPSPSPGGSGAAPGPVAPGSPSAPGVGVPGPAPGGGLTLDQLQAEYVAVVQRVGPSVVVIETEGSLGSGIVFDSNGNIVTNAHVVGGAEVFAVTLADGRQFRGSLVGTFPPNDVAVVRIDAPGLKAASFADSAKLRVGEIVLAIGNPLGLQSSVTNGIISSLGRTVIEPRGSALPGLIQTSAAINPGNSGGALVDIRGNVVGIPTLAAVEPSIGAPAPGVGFAIPSNDAADFAKQMIQDGRVTNSHRAYLGIRSADVTGAQGVLVYAVVSGGPAERAGIQAGELIVSVDGKATPNSAVLSLVLAGLQPDQRVPVEVRGTDGSQRSVEVQLGELPG